MINSNISIKLAAFIVPDRVAEAVDCKKAPGAAPCAPSNVASPVIEPYNPCEFHPPAIAPRAFLLSEVPPESLLKMCEDFKAEIFKRAGKSDYLEG